MTGRILHLLLTCHGCQSVSSGVSNIRLLFSNEILSGKELHTSLGDRKPQGKKICARSQRTNRTTQARLFFDRITKLMDDGNEID